MNTPVHVLSLADERRVETRTSVTDIQLFMTLGAQVKKKLFLDPKLTMI